jgi:hypothetical protein
MMAFITHCWKRARVDLSALIGCTLLGVLQPGLLHAQPAAAEVTQLQIERTAESVLLDASVAFKLPATVEDALLKGLPVIFVEEADVYRERWYWADKKVASKQRHMRLVFQPLTRRWRLTAGSGPISSNAELGIALSQIFDTLDEALAIIRRVSGWRIVELADIEAGVRHRVEFRFRLDLDQLPRPLQIGTLGESDWSLRASASQNLQLETPK